MLTHKWTWQCDVDQTALQEGETIDRVQKKCKQTNPEILTNNV